MTPLDYYDRDWWANADADAIAAAVTAAPHAALLRGADYLSSAQFDYAVQTYPHVAKVYVLDRLTPAQRRWCLATCAGVGSGPFPATPAPEPRTIKHPAVSGRTASGARARG